MFCWFFQINKKFEGKWKGKGTIINKVCNDKITKKIILTKLIIKKIDNYSYHVYIRNQIDKKYTNLELIGFINKNTKILEFQNSSGISQFYFNNGLLIYSYNKNKNKCLTTCTIKLVRDYPKLCSSSKTKSKTKSKSLSKTKSKTKSKSSCDTPST